MENRLELRKLKKRDKVILILLLLLAAGMLAWFWFGHQEAGAMVEVTVGGEPYGAYPLDKEQEILISGGNRLVIAGGKADMIWADCPDKLCVHQTAIFHVGESIVCLPNQVVAAVVGFEQSDEPGLDTVVQ